MPSMTDTESKRVAFLGLGRMGVAMAAHLTASGHELTVWNRTPGRAEPLVAAGAREAPTPAEAASDVDVVVLMLTGPDAVREVLFGEAGVAAGARSGTLVVDSSTIGPAAAREVARRLEEHGLRYVDAPVAGSVGPATQGTLGVLAGGAPDDVEEARPLLEAWGDPERVVHVGPVGAGSGLKLAVNLVMGVLAEGLGEALRLVRELGVDRSTALRALGAGLPGGSCSRRERCSTPATSARPPSPSTSLRRISAWRRKPGSGTCPPYAPRSSPPERPARRGTVTRTTPR